MLNSEILEASLLKTGTRQRLLISPISLNISQELLAKPIINKIYKP